jgi:CRISPR system Cascade subunit CasC
MFVELHLIQSFPPANLNRDEANSPKECQFGGVRRARISSQCQKRAIRRSPVFALTTGLEIGVRSRRFPEQLRRLLDEAGREPAEVDAVVAAFVPAFLGKLDADKERTAAPLYLAPDEMEEMAQSLLADWPPLADEAPRKSAIDQLGKEFLKAYRQRATAPDIALFGRMLAERRELDIHAACQIAHAISTHRVAMELDFFTTVDDLRPEETLAAALVGVNTYYSACFYRYARLDWEQLQVNLGGRTMVARAAAEGFLRGLVEVVPTGMQNAFAAYPLPSLVVAMVRSRGMSGSLVNAFERPVIASGDGGLVAPSVAALDSYWGRLYAMLGPTSVVRVVSLALDDGLPLVTLADSRVPTLDSWVDRTLAALTGGDAES